MSYQTQTQTLVAPHLRTPSEGFLHLEFPGEHNLYNGFNIFYNPQSDRFWAYSSPTNENAEFRLYNLIWGRYSDGEGAMFISRGSCDYRGHPHPTLRHLNDFIAHQKAKGYQYVGTAIFLSGDFQINIASTQVSAMPLQAQERVRRFVDGLKWILEHSRKFSVERLRFCEPCSVPHAVFSPANRGRSKYHCERFLYGDDGFEGQFEGGPFPEDMWVRSEDGRRWTFV